MEQSIIHIFCENCGVSCEVSYDKDIAEDQEVVFCPFCGDESLEEELLDPSEEDEFDDGDEE